MEKKTFGKFKTLTGMAQIKQLQCANAHYILIVTAIKMRPEYKWVSRIHFKSVT